MYVKLSFPEFIALICSFLVIYGSDLSAGAMTHEGCNFACRIRYFARFIGLRPKHTRRVKIEIYETLQPANSF
jgi:hypothetical protein